MPIHDWTRLNAKLLYLRSEHRLRAAMAAFGSALVPRQHFRGPAGGR
jgi:hypothetical protein